MLPLSKYINWPPQEIKENYEIRIRDKYQKKMRLSSEIIMENTQ